MIFADSPPLGRRATSETGCASGSRAGRPAAAGSGSPTPLPTRPDRETSGSPPAHPPGARPAPPVGVLARPGAVKSGRSPPAPPLSGPYASPHHPAPGRPGGWHQLLDHGQRRPAQWPSPERSPLAAGITSSGRCGDRSTRRDTATGTGGGPTRSAAGRAGPHPSAEGIRGSRGASSSGVGSLSTASAMYSGAT